MESKGLKVEIPEIVKVEATELEQQERALVADAKAFAENEKRLEQEQKDKVDRIRAELEARDAKELTATDLKHALGEDIKSRLEGDRSIIITMKHGEKPVVDFGGFWNGKLVSSAMNAISRAYRLRRYKAVRPFAGEPNIKENGDGRTE